MSTPRSPESSPSSITSKDKWFIRETPLIDIDPRPYEAQVLEAEGTLEKDRAVLKQAQMDLARYKDASDQQAIARQTFEDQAQLVEQEEGTVKNDLGTLQYAQTQLSYCHLVSPITGRIGLRLIDPGNTVFSGSQECAGSHYPAPAHHRGL